VRNGASSQLAPGALTKSASGLQYQDVKVGSTLLKAGRYQYVCTIGEHAIKGMQGTLTVVK